MINIEGNIFVHIYSDFKFVFLKRLKICVWHFKNFHVKFLQIDYIQYVYSL